MKEKDYIIRSEKETEHKQTENLVRESFWNVYRPGCTEHYVLHCMRGKEGFVKELDFVMEKDGELIGQVVYYRAKVATEKGDLDVLTFGPICIAPKYKRQGYGKILLDYSVDKATKLGAGALFTEGNIDFYGKSGFRPAKEIGITYKDDPSADYFIYKELKNGFLDGVTGTYSDPEVYFSAVLNPEAFEEYDKGFPKKEKKADETQIFGA